MLEMKYCEKRFKEAKVLENERYKGFKYYVISWGTHPCAYINVTDTIFEGLDDWTCNIDLPCHGGITYSDIGIVTITRCGRYIGWDYAHYGDYSGRCVTMSYIEMGKRWTTKEIIAECEQTIDKLIEIEERVDKIEVSRYDKIRFLDNILRTNVDCAADFIEKAAIIESIKKDIPKEKWEFKCPTITTKQIISPTTFEEAIADEMSVHNKHANDNTDKS